MVTVALLLAAAAIAALASAVVRVVPAGSCAVVSRGGRVTRTRAAGPVVALPLVERVDIVPLHTLVLDPLAVCALTRDAVEVRLIVSVLWRVADPALAVRARPDRRSAAADAVERAMRHVVATVDLVDLLREREPFLERLRVQALPLAARAGVEVEDVDLVDAEVRVGPQLLRMLV